MKTPDRVKKLERDFDMNGKPSTHIFREFDISKITSTDDIEIIGLE